MLKIVLSALLIAEVGAQCVAPWAQCGGENYSGVTTCSPGYTCQYSNPYYSQCKSDPNPDVQCPSNNMYNQCGGENYNGETCCPAGSSCEKINDYYYQCLPTWNGNGPCGSGNSNNNGGEETSSSTQNPETSSTTTTDTTTSTQPSSQTTSEADTPAHLQPYFENVKATQHAANEVGACRLPQGSYTVQYPVALGDIDALKSYKFSGSLCGHILEINCGNGDMEIIVTNSNLGGGLDLYLSSWNKATNYLPAGITYCSVQLSSKNIFVGEDGYKCFYNENQGYYRNLILLNTKERIVNGATLDNGNYGTQEGAYWVFYGDSRDATSVIFSFTDGDTYEVPIADCQSGVDKQMWS